MFYFTNVHTTDRSLLDTLSKCHLKESESLWTMSHRLEWFCVLFIMCCDSRWTVWFCSLNRCILSMTVKCLKEQHCFFSLNYGADGDLAWLCIPRQCHESVICTWLTLAFLSSPPIIWMLHSPCSRQMSHNIIIKGCKHMLLSTDN